MKWSENLFIGKISAASFVFTFFIFSCSSEEVNDSETAPSDTTNSVVEQIDSIDNSSSTPAFPATWESLSAIQRSWIKLERDKDGYLIYEPCDGVTPTIFLDDSTSTDVAIYWEDNTSSKMYTNKCTRVKGREAFYRSTANKDDEVEIYAEIKDVDRRLVLWKFATKNRGSFYWVMTPIEFKDEFRFIKDSCGTQSSEPRKFLPVEFTSDYKLNLD